VGREPPPSTPGGAPPDSGPGRAGSDGGGADDIDDLSPEEREALATRLEELRNQLMATPAEVVIANHAYGLFELAAIHLSQQPPQLEQARLAVDALGAVVGALTGRLGEAEPSLHDALAQIRLTFVQIAEMMKGQPADDPGAGAGPTGATSSA